MQPDRIIPKEASSPPASPRVRGLLPPRLVPLLRGVRATTILSAYAAHFRHARRKFRGDRNGDSHVRSAVNDVDAWVFRPGEVGSVMALDSTYESLVRQTADDVDKRFRFTSNYALFPATRSSDLPARTDDVPEIRSGDCISMQLKEYVHVEGLNELATVVARVLQAKIYGSYVIVDKVYIYRNLPTRLHPQVSWLWHYDNHPNEILKVMIYLTDVRDETAPFEFLGLRDSGRALKATARPLVGSSRLSADEISGHVTRGYAPTRVIGAAGTLILFDNNIVHRANLAEGGHRDVVVLQVRPATFSPPSAIHPDWTGSFPHVDFNWNPYVYRPRLKNSV